MSQSDLEIRPALQVARRALALYAMLMRINIEHSWGWGDEEISEDEADIMRDRLLTWLDEEGILSYAEELEMEIIEAEIGDLTEWQIREVSYRLEGLGVLMWGLERLEDLAAYDEGFLDDEVLAELPNLERAIDDFIDYAGMRAEDELLLERRICELWSYRLKQFDVDEAKNCELSEAVKKRLEDANNNGIVSNLAQEDLVAFGKPLHRLSKDEIEELRIITTERMKAFNWLFGLGDSWDRSPGESTTEI
jgi:Domain of unknown function (DUF4272)